MSSKRMVSALKARPSEEQSPLSLEQAIDACIKISKDPSTGEKFDASVDVAMRLGIPVGESVRGSVCPEHGLGKSVKVAVFAKGEHAIAAEKAGADVIGAEDLAEAFSKGEVECDVVVATPDMMAVVGKLGRVLGPKGLMPNPKDGTVSPDPAKSVENMKRGQVFFRTDKQGAVHARVAPSSFDASKIVDNIKLLVSEVKRLKPARAKGQYIRSFYISTTMGPGIAVDINTLD
ncbi:50S ribosomal protein L1 [Gammaproteobacteria bacterium]|nr:50S ribosomal protein L1 [Gammaproteobacteria bacterium]